MTPGRSRVRRLACAGVAAAALFPGAFSSAVAQIPCLSGFVTDNTGAPVVDADLDLFDPVTGIKLVTPGDNTDPFGFYSVCVLPGIFDVAFGPPPGTHLLGVRFPRIDLTTGRELDVVLQPGLVIRGRVTDTAGQPVGDVDLDVDQLGGGRVFTPNDNTDLVTGEYWIVVPPGAYRVRYQPPAGSLWRGFQIDSVSISADTVIDVRLPEGVVMTGRVANEFGQGVRDVDVDLRDDATGAKIYVANNSTDTGGSYRVAVPTGVFELRFTPPRGSRYLGSLRDSLSIATDVHIDETLSAGLLVTVVVRDSTGAPVAGADIDFNVKSSGVKIFTPHDNTDDSGIAPVAVPPDLYAVEVDPPIGTTFERVTLDNVTISSDTTLSVVMPEVARVRLTGQVTDTTGAGIPGVELRLAWPGSGRSVYLVNNVSDTSGRFDIAVPEGTFELLLAPPAGSRFVGERGQIVSFSSDTAWTPLTLETGHLVTVELLSDAGGAIAGADLDFWSETQGRDVYTPHDNTDVSGRALVTVPTDRYTIQVDPPAGSPWSPLTVSGVSLNSDTLLVLLASTGGTLPEAPFVLHPNYPNPFNAGTTIRFTMLREGDVELDIFNLMGRPVCRLAAGWYGVGTHTVRWDGLDESGRRSPSGLYIYRLEGKGEALSRKLVLLR